LIPKLLLAARTGGVFFLHGDDEFRKQASSRFLVERYADPATRDFNLDRLQGSEVSVERLASVVATPPMMAEWRVVHLKEAEALASSPKARQVILDVAKNPSPGLVLILQASIPKRSKARFYKDLGRIATSVEFSPVPLDSLPSWLVTWAGEELDTTLELDAARGLAHSAGNDLGVLTQELRKLAEMVGTGDSIGVEDVRRGGIELPRQDRWAWFDLVGNRRIDEAMRGLRVLLDHGESGVGLVIGLSTHLLRVGIAAEGGAPALNAVLPPYQRFVARRIVGQARRWKRAELKGAIRRLRRLDQLLKASALPDDVLIEEWLLGCQLFGADQAAPS